MSVRRLAPKEVQPASFAFTPENLEWAKKEIAKYPAGRQASAVIAILWRVQEQHDGWVSEAAIRAVADLLGPTPVPVDELIRQSGLEPHKDIAIEFTGIRPGEKLYEELAGAAEQTLPTKHPKIRTWQLPAATPAQIDHMLATLTPVLNAPRDQVISALCQIVPEYTPNGGRPAPTEETPKLRLVA